MAIIERELAAGYQRIKLKCKPGWDVEVFEKVRSRWPGITLSCDANSAYRLKRCRSPGHLRRLRSADDRAAALARRFLLPLHAAEAVEPPICLDESIRNRRDALAAIEMESCKIINIKLGRVGGFSEAIAVHNAAQERGIPVWCGGMLEAGIGRSHNIALSTLENFSLPGDVSASARYWREDIIEPEITVSPQARLRFPTRRAAATKCAPIWWSGSPCARKRFAPSNWSAVINNYYDDPNAQGGEHRGLEHGGSISPASAISMNRPTNPAHNSPTPATTPKATTETKSTLIMQTTPQTSTTPT
jgi:hypothetical protein